MFGDLRAGSLFRLMVAVHLRESDAYVLLYLGLSFGLLLVAADDPREADTDLPDMIRHERRSHWDTFSLPERVELHCAQKVDDYLRNLIRPSERH